MLACAACTTRAGDPSGAPAEVRNAGATAATTEATGASKGGQAAAAGPAGPDTLGQIRSLIGGAECSSDNQCRILPVGARPCGGPVSYLAWSTAKTDESRLQALAERHKTEQQASNTASGRMSTCIAIAPPAVACRAGACQLTDALATQ